MPINVGHGGDLGAAAIMMGGMMPPQQKFTDVQKYLLHKQDQQDAIRANLYSQAWQNSQREKQMQFQAANQQQMQQAGFEQNQQLQQVRGQQQAAMQQQQAQQQQAQFDYKLTREDEYEIAKINKSIDEIKRKQDWTPEMKQQGIQHLEMRRMGIQPKEMPKPPPPDLEQEARDNIMFPDANGGVGRGMPPPGYAGPVWKRNRNGVWDMEEVKPAGHDLELKRQQAESAIANKEVTAAAQLHQKQEAHDYKMYETNEKRWADRLAKMEDEALAQNIDKTAQDDDGKSPAKLKRPEEDVLKEVRERHARLYGPKPEYKARAPLDVPGGIDFSQQQPQPAPQPAPEPGAMNVPDQVQPPAAPQIEPFSPEWLAAEPKLKPLMDAKRREAESVKRDGMQLDTADYLKNFRATAATPMTLPMPSGGKKFGIGLKDGGVYLHKGRRWVYLAHGATGDFVMLPEG
jgi:hypothetical protein